VIAATIASAAVPGPALLMSSALLIVAVLLPATASASSASGSGARSICRAHEVSSWISLPLQAIKRTSGVGAKLDMRWSMMRPFVTFKRSVAIKLID
jgi:hypothetical protein